MPGLADISFNFGKYGPDKDTWLRFSCALKEEIQELKEIQSKTHEELAVHIATDREKWKYGCASAIKTQESQTKIFEAWEHGCKPIKEIKETQELIKKVLGFLGLAVMGSLIWAWVERK